MILTNLSSVFKIPFLVKSIAFADIYLEVKSFS